MSLASTFKNFGHAIASGAKYFEKGVLDALLVAQKAQVLEPAAVGVVTALAGPQAAALADLGFHALGSLAEALQTVNTDALGDVASKGVNVQLDVQTAQDIKSLAEIVKTMLQAKGSTVPAPSPKL